MDDPLKTYRLPLKTYNDALNRCDYSSVIEPHLEYVDSANWISLYRCIFDRSFWIQEHPRSELHGGGPNCYYLYEDEDPINSFKTIEGKCKALRSLDEARSYWNSLMGRETDEICQKDSCNFKAISDSVMCKRHHFEMIRSEPCPF